MNHRQLVFVALIIKGVIITYIKVSDDELQTITNYLVRLIICAIVCVSRLL